VDQPRVVQEAKTRARAHKHSSREATGLAHQAVVALMSRLHCSSEGPVGTQRDGQVRRVQVTLGYNRCRTPWLGCAQTVARRVYADHRLKPGSREEEHSGAVVASNRTREIRPSGIIGRLWEPSPMEGLGSRSVTERADVGHSPPTVLRAQFLSRSSKLVLPAKVS